MDVEISTSRAGGGCGCGGCLSMVFSMGFGLALTVGILVVINTSHQASDQAAIEAFEACPAITDALGTPLEKVPWSMSCGEYEGSGNRGEADWTIKVRGPKGTASGWYAATYVGDDPWMVHSAQLDLPGGQTVRAVPCEGGARPAPEPDEPARERDRSDRDKGDKDKGRDKGAKGGKSKGGKGKRR